MTLLPLHTIARMTMEERTGTKAPAITCWADGTGGLYKVMTITFHFENGTWFSERTLPGSWNGDGTWEETDTDYDEGFNGGENGDGYGNAVPPYETYAFSDAVTQSDVEAQVTSMSATWGGWSGLFDIVTDGLADAFAHNDGSTIAWSTGFTAYTITKTDNSEAGLGGWSAAVTLIQARLTNQCPLSCKVTYQSGLSGTATATVTPGQVWDIPAPDVVIDAAYNATISGLQWLPWSG